MKFLKYLLLLVAVILLGAILLAAGGYYLAKDRPAFYRPYAWEIQQRAALNQRALDKLLRTQNLAAGAQAAERRAQLGTAAHSVPQALTVALSEEEINAFLTHNAELEGLNKTYERYAQHPGIFLKKGQIILAAEVKELGCLVSIHLEPKLDAQGKLHVDLVRSTVGRLPVPKALASKQLAQFRSALTSRLPRWQRDAAIDSTGRTNQSAVTAAMAKLLLGLLDNKPADAVLFMPLGQSGKSVPLRLTDLQVEEQSLKFTVEPLSAAERMALLKSIRS
ncbi:MAG: hypothetical protein ACM359_08865 [Bacillota bacterium]